MLQICLRRRTAGRCGASSGILSSSVEQDRRKLVDSVSMTLSGLACRGDCPGDGGKASGGFPLRVRFSGAGAGTGQASAGEGGGAAMAGGRWRLTRRGAAPRGESSASRELRFGRL